MMELHNDTAPNYRPLLLLRNISYPTYQLYARAGGTGKDPKTVLKIVILETLAWLRQRFREFELPSELDKPHPDEYEQLKFSDLSSFHLNMGYKLVVIWLPEQKIWTLQLTEPDLGPQPGMPSQPRPPVPGRLFETNITYGIKKSIVECGFKTVVHEPHGTNVFCEVFRLAFIKNLARNPLVGLEQVWKLQDMPHELSDAEKIRKLNKWLKDSRRTMPALIFADYEEPQTLSDIQQLDRLPAVTSRQRTHLPFLKETLPVPAAQTAPTYRYFEDISVFARYRMGYAQFFILPSSQRENFNNRTNRIVENGEIAVIEPDSLGGKMTRYPYIPAAYARGKKLKELDEFIQNYPKGKSINFGDCVFVPEARKLERENILGKHRTKENLVEYYEERIRENQHKHEAALSKEREDCETAKRRVEKLKLEITKLAEDKECLNLQIAKQKKSIAQAEERQHRLETRIEWNKNLPKTPKEVSAWVAREFDGRMLFHERAKDELSKTDTNKVDMAQMCNALEYLAVEYRDGLTGVIDEHERDLRCSDNYGRPFEVTPINSETILMFKQDYHVKYRSGNTGQSRERALDLHLKIGNDSENLLRIYFFYDKELKLIVVGSLPLHLKTKSYR